MFTNKQQKEIELEILCEKIELKKREYKIAEDEILLREKLSEVSKFSSLIEENNQLRKRNEYLENELEWAKQAIICSIENGTNLIDKRR